MGFAVGVVLCLTRIAATDVQMLFKRYVNQTFTAATPVDTFIVPRIRGCHFYCLHTPGCVALVLSGTSCNLYDNYVIHPEIELQNSAGAVLYSEGKLEAYI